MARYIDADALINEIMTEWGGDPKYFETDDDHTVALSAYGDVRTLERISKAPTADVQEVKHGKWLLIENDEDELWEGGGHYECSACGYGYSFDGYFELNEEPYCPHCGAKMEATEKPDFVDVVRCKCCEHSTPYSDDLICNYWTAWGGISVPEDGFCSNGERRTDEEPT